MDGKYNLFRIIDSHRKLVVANVKQSMIDKKRKVINKILEDNAIDNYCDNESSYR